MAANDYTRSVSITPQSASYSWSTPPSWVTINRVGTSNDWTITIAPNSGIYRSTIIYVTHSNGVTTDSMNITQEGVSSGGGAGPTSTPVSPTATPTPTSGAGAGPTATPISPTATPVFDPLVFTLYSASGTSVSTGRSYTWTMSGTPVVNDTIVMGIYSTNINYTMASTNLDTVGAAYAAYLNGVTAAQWKAAGVYSYTQGNPVGFEPTASYDAANNRLTFNMNWVNTISPPYVNAGVPSPTSVPAPTATAISSGSGGGGTVTSSSGSGSGMTG